MSQFKALLIGGLLLQSSSFAHDLVAPARLESVRIEQNHEFRFESQFHWIDSRVDGGQQAQSIAAPLMQGVSWQGVMADWDVYEQNKLRSILGNHSLKESDLAGLINSEAHAFEQRFAPSIHLVRAEDFKLTISLPVTYLEWNTKTVFQKQNDSQKIVDIYCNDYPDRCDWFIEQINHSASNHKRRLKEMGYHSQDEHQSKVSLNEIEISGQWIAYQNFLNAISISMSGFIPVSDKPSADYLVNLPFYEGNFAVTPGIAYSRKLSEVINFDTYLKYRWNVEDELEKRIPIASDSLLSADRERVIRDLGDVAQFGMAMAYRFPRISSFLTAGYDFQFQFRNRYKGSKYEPSRYEWLEELEYFKRMHSGRVGASFSTEKWYKKEQFPFDLALELNYGFPISGKNSDWNGVYSAGLGIRL